MADIQFPNQILGPGTFTAQVLDNNGAPASVLEASEEFSVKAAWTIDPLSAALLGGQWQVSVYAESIGPGPEEHLGTTVRALSGATSYSAVVTVPKNKLPNDPAPPASGVYKLVTVLTHRNFGRISNIAALVEGPMVRIG